MLCSSLNILGYKKFSSYLNYIDHTKFLVVGISVAQSGVAALEVAQAGKQVSKIETFFSVSLFYSSEQFSLFKLHLI